MSTKHSGRARFIAAALFAGAATMLSAGHAAADDATWQRMVDGLYVEGRLLAPLTDTFTGDGVSTVAAANGGARLSFHSGYSFAVAVGTRVMPRVRAEAEIQHTVGKDAKVFFRHGFVGNAFQGQRLKSRGDATLTIFAVNAFYDVTEFDVGGNRVVPFVGAGIGAMHVDVDNMSPDGARFDFNDSDTVAAGSLHAGADIAITDKVTATARYTVAAVQELSFNGTDTTGAGAVTRAEVDAHLEHYVGIGLRVSLY
jgi:opacity protein-like surface antigen